MPTRRMYTQMLGIALGGGALAGTSAAHDDKTTQAESTSPAFSRMMEYDTVCAKDDSVVIEGVTVEMNPVPNNSTNVGIEQCYVEGGSEMDEDEILVSLEGLLSGLIDNVLNMIVTSLFRSVINGGGDTDECMVDGDAANEDPLPDQNGIFGLLEAGLSVFNQFRPLLSLII